LIFARAIRHTCRGLELAAFVGDWSFFCIEHGLIRDTARALIILLVDVTV